MRSGERTSAQGNAKESACAGMQNPAPSNAKKKCAAGRENRSVQPELIHRDEQKVREERERDGYIRVIQRTPLNGEHVVLRETGSI